MVQIYTGNGKGKTTAAIGQAVRAAGAGIKVGFYQFLKGGKFHVSEEKVLGSTKNIYYMRFKEKSPIFDKKARGNDFLIRVREDLDVVCDDIINKGYGLIVLDELTHLINLKLADERQIIEMIDKRPKGLEVVITGRSASKDLIKMADLVTEMKEVKHPYKSGVKARKGIEF